MDQAVPFESLSPTDPFALSSEPRTTQHRARHSKPEPQRQTKKRKTKSSASVSVQRQDSTWAERPFDVKRAKQKSSLRKKRTARRQNSQALSQPQTQKKSFSWVLRGALYSLSPIFGGILTAGMIAALQQECGISDAVGGLGLVLLGKVVLMFVLIPLVRCYEPAAIRLRPWRVLGRVFLVQALMGLLAITLVGMMTKAQGALLYCW